MNLKKLFAISDQFSNFASPRKKVVSGFGLGVISFFLVLCVVFFNVSLKNPISNNSVFQGFNVDDNNGSVISWPFSFSRTRLNSTSGSPSRAIVVKNSTSVQKSPGNLVNSVGSNGFDVDLSGSKGKVLDFGDAHLSNFTEDVKNGSFNGISEEVLDLGDFKEDVNVGSSNGNYEKVLDLGDTHLGNFTEDVKNGSFNGNSEKVLDLGDTHLGNFTKDVKNGSSNGISEKVLDLGDTHLGNFTEDVKNGSFNRISEKVLDLGDTQLRNFTEDVKNASFNRISEKILNLEDTQLRNFTDDVKNGTFNPISKKPIEGKLEINGENGNGTVESLGFNPNFDPKNNADSNANGVLKKGNFNGTMSQDLILRNYSSFYGECDIFNGRWVRDDTKPYYPAGSCPFIDRDFDCHLNKRPDDGYVKWKWQPFGCEIPSLNATDFLERLRGKKLVFVGDSLNRNMWESLVCILRQSLKYKKRVYEISGRTEFKKKGFYAFRFEDYNCTVDFVSSPFLVKESSFKGKNGSFETLRLDLMDQTTSMYHDADVLVFNTGHWWTHEKTSRGEDYYQEGNHVYPRLKVLNAYTRALSTWASWVDKNIDHTKTQVIFRGYSVTHFRGGQWNSGGQCHKETEPIFNTSHLTKYPSKMRSFDNVLREMKTPVIYLNISRLTDYRKDGHPSIYRMEYKSVEEQIAAERSQDCSHWCLPGVPDTWNELLYASLLKVGRGSWKI